MSNQTLTAADHLTFTKLFAQRDGASFAKVLHECISTEDLVRAFNKINKTSLALDDKTGLVVVKDTQRGDLKAQIDLFATFAWQDVFLNIQHKRAA
jgi:hypothetical protein